ncbi:MAG: hypothetical protein KDA81_17585 [Planctomycetaceae bacterium]|nr:hypothetical protein [Planctomycetaceae bacterium]
MFTPDSDDEVYCFLKVALEPAFQVVAEPGGDYFCHQQFCYRILRDSELLYELKGDFAALPQGSLVHQAISIVQEIQDANSEVNRPSPVPQS